MADQTFRPAGDNKITRVFSRFKLSIRFKERSGFNNIPGPPPKAGRPRSCAGRASSRAGCGFSVQQTGIARTFDDAFIERPGEHRREQSEHVNFTPSSSFSSSSS